jgi:hypothetical protein
MRPNKIGNLIEYNRARMENVATYSEARSEYTKQLSSFIVPVMVLWFQQLWGRNAHDKQRCLSLFQTECEEISRWNQDRIQDEVRVLIERTGCDYMEELITAVFVAHTKVLTAIRLSSKQKKLSITVPKLDHFLHRVFREISRCFWKTPFLFMETGNVMERQKNILQIEALATEAITTAVRGLLPVKEILQDYLDEDKEEDLPTPVQKQGSEKKKEEEKSTTTNKKEDDKPVTGEETDENTSTEEKATETNTEEKESNEKEPVEKEPIVKETTKKEELHVKENTASDSKESVQAETESTLQNTIQQKITELSEQPSVHFSNFDTLIDTKNVAEPRYTPKASEEDESSIEGENGGRLHIIDSSSSTIQETDFEDLEKPPTLPARDTIDETDVEILT